MKEYKTCTHIHDNGHYCQWAAVSGRNFCVYHLRHRGLGMRMAQAPLAVSNSIFACLRS